MAGRDTLDIVEVGVAVCGLARRFPFECFDYAFRRPCPCSGEEEVVTLSIPMSDCMMKAQMNVSNV